MPMKVFIIGYYGSDNIGDEVLLHQTIRMIREIDPEAEITSLSYRTSRTRELHGIDSVSRNRYREILRAIHRADWVIGGGGSMLQNVTSNRSLIYYLALIRLAKALGKRVALLGNGFGPINGRFFTGLTRRILNRIDAFAARDEETIRRLEDLGLKAPVLDAADLAYYGYAPGGAECVRRVIVNLRPWRESQDRLVASLAGLIAHVEAAGYEVSYLSMQAGLDEKLCRALETALGHSITRQEISVERFIHDKDQAFCLVGMRLHALIWGGIRDLPMIGVSYDPKIDAYLQQTGQINAGPVDGITSESLIAAFEKLEVSREHYLDQLREGNRTLADKAAVNRTTLENILEKEA